MLIIHRSARQKIHVGDDIVIEVRRVDDDQVILAIRAPNDAYVTTGEVRAINRERQKAGRLKPFRPWLKGKK